MKILLVPRLITTLTVLFMAGCAQSPQEEESDGQRTAIHVGADITTRADGVRWDDGDQIGITMFEHGGSVLAEGNFSNCRYIISSATSGIFEPYDTSNTIYLPQTGDMADFIAYYPYTATMQTGYVIPIDVADQQILRNIDFMTAYQMAGVSKSDPRVKLHFQHRLSKIIVNLKTEFGDSWERLENSRVTIDGMLAEGSYTLTNNAAGVVPSPSSGVSLELGSYNDGRQAVGIVLPRAAAPGITFNITLSDGSKYTAYMAANLTLAEGFQYVFNITLTKTPINVSADIQPWSDGPVTDLTSLVITTPPNASSGVAAGDRMAVFTNSNPLGIFTYNGTKWTSFSSIYWEQLAGNSINFEASLEPLGAAAALNNTQLPDYRVAIANGIERNQSVNFSFEHLTAQVQVVLASSDGSFSNTELSSAVITLPNYLAGGYLDKYTFIPGSVPANILLKNGLARIQPQTITAGTLLVTINIAGIDHSAFAVGDVVYLAGHAQRIYINMLKTQLQVSAQVVNWIPETDVVLTAQYLTVTTPGSTSGFTSGNQIQVFALKDNKTSSFTYNGTNWTTTTPLYWDNLTTPAQIAATYPVTSAPVNNIIPWSISGDQSSAGYANSDLLVGYIPSLNIGNAANLSFKHAMSKAIIILTPGTGFTTSTLGSATVKLNNMHSSCTVNLTNLAIGNINPGLTDFTPHLDSPLHFSAVIMPGVIQSGTQLLTVTIDSVNYPVALASDITFSSTKVTTITITVNKTPIGISCSVQDWTVGDNGNYVIQ